MDKDVSEMGLLLRIRQALPSLAGQERRVAEYVLANPHQALSDTITRMADACGVSVTTVSRVCRRLDLGGYRQFKFALAQEWGSPENLIYVEIEPGDTLASVCRKVFAANIRALHDTQKILDLQVLERVVDSILAARRVDVYATGGAGIAARELHFKCMQLGINANAFLDSQMQMMSAASLTGEDVGIGISHSGRQPHVAEALREARAGGSKTISLTSYPNTPVARAADMVLYTASLGAATAHDSPSVRNAQLAVVDLIYEALVIKGKDPVREKMSRVSQAITEYATGDLHRT